MAPEPVIRQAVLSDAGAIAAVHVASWRESYQGMVPDDYLAALDVDQRAASWRAALESGTPEIWVASDADRVVGWIAFAAARDADAAPTTGEIWALYLRRSHWQRQLGAALLKTACACLSQRGFESVVLWVFARNERARRFYERSGFQAETLSLRQFELGGAQIDELRYSRALDQESDAPHGGAPDKQIDPLARVG